MDRIQKLCTYLETCKSFADVGCDHGYCTLYMLKNGLCKSAVISDISQKCLEKARTLLEKYVTAGIVKPVCCSGLKDIDPSVEQVLIAGMGGDEITEILKTSFIPQKFVLQPMKNPRAVREYLLSNGAEITVDEVFQIADKFYTVIKGKRLGKEVEYTPFELEYGKTLNSAAARNYLKSELYKKKSYLEKPLNAQTRERITREANELMEALKNDRQ